jgi:phosphatidylglycerophosphatase A
MNRTIIFIATGAYSGLAPFAPGTAGSLAGLLVYLLAYNLSLPYYMASLFMISIVGLLVSGKAEIILKEKDSGKIVIDEIAGIFFTFLAIPFSWTFLILGFLLFRLFDIFKPIPQLEQLPGGWGIMLDDIAAGIISNIILHTILSFSN